MFCFVLLCVFFICPIYKDPYQDSTSGTEKNLPSITFLDTQVSLAPTHVSWLVGPSHFRISNLWPVTVEQIKKLKK